MKKYITGIMSNKIEMKAENIDEAICVSMLYFRSNAPIAVYETEENSTLFFPYNDKLVDNILGNMGDRLKKVYNSIKKVS